MIEFPKKLNSADLKAKLGRINNNEFLENDFLLPNEVNYSGFGIIPLSIIYFFTWLRNNKKGDVFIDIDEADTDKLKSFGSDYLGYCLLSSAWKHKDIVNLKQISLKGPLRKYTQQLHSKIDFLQELTASEILVPFFDHYSKQQGLSHWFYNNQFDFAGSPEELSSTLYRLFVELGKIYKTKLIKNTSQIIEDLEIILWELIKNTDEHATKDYLNITDLSPNIRGLYMKIHRKSKKSFITEAKNDKGLTNYFESILEEGDNFLLEISVFDSGPGLPRRYKGAEWSNDISINEEVNIIKQCLYKGNSSAKGIKGSLKGFGLNNVLITLSAKKGFLQIRTGRTMLYRDLLKSPHFEETDFSKIELQDVETNSPSNFTGLPEIPGTAISMYYPLK